MSELRLLAGLLAGFVFSGSMRARAAEYRGYLQASGEIGWPSGDRAPTVTPGAGWDLSFGLGLRQLPVLVGLRAGDLYVSGGTRPGPVVGVASAGGLVFTGTSLSRRFELRHLELSARVEPSWTPVRPFVEASAGLVALWHVSSVDAAGEQLDRWEEQRSIAPGWSASAGIDILPWCKSYEHLAWRTEGSGAVCAGLTMGAGSWNIAPLDSGQVEVNATGSPLTLRSSTSAIHTWFAFLGVTFVFDAEDPIRARAGDSVSR